MRNTKKIKFFSILLAVALLLTALPLSAALAADEATPTPTAEPTPTPVPTPVPAGHIFLLQEVSDEEKGYLQTQAAYAGDSITFYVPIINKNLESATGMSC